jgi:hypothetical protein
MELFVTSPLGRHLGDGALRYVDRVESGPVAAVTEEDHERFDRYRGAIYESPGVWWTFP